ncbi:all-trans-retinol 13,14-reductase-like [Branchiostoma floridae x Branchiostoma belcheri]
MAFITNVAASFMSNPGLVVLVVALIAIVFMVTSNRKPRGKNPFAADCRRPPAPLVTDQAARDRVIKNGFVIKKVPETLDAVVVGSGIGGLGVAAMMAKAGKRVLVLEQHDQAGGCCHTFIEKGFEFDVGVHYIGEMCGSTINKVLFDQLTEGQLQWEKLDDAMDVVALGAENPRKFPIVQGNEAFKKALLEKFPEEEKAIDGFLLLLKKVRKSMLGYVGLRSLPQWLARLLVKTGLVNYMTNYFKYASKSVKQTLDELTDNQDLKAVLSYSFGDYGTPPKDAPFTMHATLISHYYYNGGYYPIGGASEIAFHMIPVIEKAGGAVLVRAPVTQILIDSSGAACGVRVHKSSGDIDIHAPIVISDAGLYNTYQSLLPKEVAVKHGLDRVLSKVRHGVGAVSLFVGLRGTKEELGLKAQNCWAFTHNDLDAGFEEYANRSAEDAGKADVPLLFISFPSSKDPSHEQRYPGKSTCTVITLCPYEWFEKWEDERVMKRGQEYKDLKMSVAARIWDQTCRLYPQIKDRVEYFEMGTPITNKYYIAAPRGEIYGIDHNMARFSADTVTQLHPETPVPNLYLTGQDIFCCGLAGALFGSILSANSVLNRNVMFDLMNLRKKIAKTK